jgi:cob(I)alamin adenosyltransferase
VFELDAKGLIHVYCGDGKGKTTAALGLSIRAAGSGRKVVIVQFLKNYKTSELYILNQITNITVLRGKEGAVFSFSMTEEEKEKTRRVHAKNLQTGIELVESGHCDLLILDEAIEAYNQDLLDRQVLRDLVEHKPQQLELVLTGRNPEPWIIDCADYVSEIKKVKHPFDKGIKARKGIEK